MVAMAEVLVEPLVAEWVEAEADAWVEVRVGVCGVGSEAVMKEAAVWMAQEVGEPAEAAGGEMAMAAEAS